jgi:eukaryotic-like serine/threonine-protein kinase
LDTARSRLAWFDRSGKTQGTVGADAFYGDLALSRDGRHAAVAIAVATTPFGAVRGGDIWLFDLGRNIPVRFTFEDTGTTTAIWSADNKTIVFNSGRKGRLDLYRKASSGTEPDEELVVNENDKYPLDWSSDDKFILYRQGSQNDANLWVVPTTGDGKPFVFLDSRFNEAMGTFSPDGRWIAFRSNESGRAEIYVAPFPGPGKKVRVSTAGAEFGDPHWRGNGRELFYIASDNKLMAVLVNGFGSEFEVGAARPLFEILPPSRPVRHQYDVTADGERFLVNISSQNIESAPITLVVNWTAGLKH